jgi:hypothetical protein
LNTLVAGAFAVAYDIPVRATAQNARLVARTLDPFGFGTLGVTAEDFQIEGKIVQLGVQPNRIDLLTSISGVKFDEAWRSREEGDLEGIQDSSAVAKEGFSPRRKVAKKKQILAAFTRDSPVAHPGGTGIDEPPLPQVLPLISPRSRSNKKALATGIERFSLRVFLCGLASLREYSKTRFSQTIRGPLPPGRSIMGELNRAS